jgi:hypothetical protein
MGQKVRRALTEAGIAHYWIVHPAARGSIRERSRYIAHVRRQLRRLPEGPF